MSRLVKLLSLLLCLVLLMSVPAVFAQESAETVQPCCVAPEPQVGPVIMEEAKEGRPTRAITYHTTEAAAAVELRTAMENRQTTINIGYRSTAYTQEFVDYIYPTLKDQALAHTGVDYQGDYLRREYDGYSGSCSAYRSGGYYYCTLTYYMSYKTTAAQEAELTAALDTFIADNIESSMTDYKKFRVCYDWICENIRYDYDHLGNSDYRLQYTAYAGMFDKTCVCAGYASLLYRMLLLCDIDNRVITGIGNGGYHAWNIVQMPDGYYYDCDSTWDEGCSPQSYNYCLLSEENFTDHTRDEEFDTTAFHTQYPMGASNYVASEDFVTQAEAIGQLRQALKNRSNSIKVCIAMTQKPTDAVILELTERVLAHNGVADEGDYLRYHIYSMTPTVEYITLGGRYLVTLNLQVVYYSTLAQEKDLTAAINSFKAANIKTGMSDYEKFDAIYSWICSNISYGYSGDGGSNAAAYTAMIHKGGSPRAFATLLYRLLLECGVDCRAIKGTVNNGTGVHYWNIVKMDGLYYNADAGWDASYFQKNGKYYCRLECNNTFTNHVRDTAYNTTDFNSAYPMGTTDYVPTAKFDIDVARMILGNALEFQFGVDKSKFTTTTGYYAVVEKEWADGSTTTKTIPAGAWGTVGSYWAISYDGLAAKEMGDEISVTIYNADGAAISNAKTDSVRDYVMRNVDKQSDVLKTLMVNMLNYGAAAQLEFNYAAGDLANNQLTNAQKAWGSTGVKELGSYLVKGTNYMGTRLVLESRIQLQVAFKGMTRSMYAVYTFTDNNGKLQTVRVEGADFVDVGILGVEMSALVYADARNVVNITVYNANGTVYGTATDSIEGYAKRNVTDPDDVVMALMKFADSAKAYLYG